MEHTLQTYVVDVFNSALKAKGIKQLEIADKMKFNRQRVWNYLTGKSDFSLTMFENFCQAIDVDMVRIVENYINQEVPEKITESILIPEERREDAALDVIRAESEIYKELCERLQRENVRLDKRIDKLEKELELCDIENQKLKDQLNKSKN